MHERTDRVHPRVAMSDHDTLRTRRRSTCVIDGNDVGFCDVNAAEAAGRFRDQGFIGKPSGSMALKRDEMLYTLKAAPNGVNGFDLIGMHAHDGGATVVDHVKKVLGRQPVVQGHDDGADLRYGVERLEHRMRVRRYDGNSIALRDAESLQSRRPSVATVEEFGIGEPPLVFDDSLWGGG